MKTLIPIIIALFMSLPTSGFAESADEIMEKAHLNAYYAGDDGKAVMAMLVYSKNSRKPMKKTFTMIKKDIEDGGRQKFFIYFQKPADIKKTTFLVHKNIDGDDYRRLYIPASDKVIPIAGSRKQDPFMGSDYSYEDISGRHFTKDNHRQVGEETVKVKNRKKTKLYETYVMESIPKVREDQIAKIKSWIDQKTYTPIKVEFTNHDGKVYKVYQSYRIKKIDGYPTILKRVMTSPLDGTRTVILVNPKKTRYNLGIPASAFQDRSLKNPPRKYFK
jgi:hypothetical protein